MAWIEVHQSLWDHRKTLAVADALDLPELYTAAHMIALWTWTMDNAPDGTFPVTVTSRIIARGAKWTGDPEAFVHALIDAGFLEYTPSGQVYVHDWDQYGGKLNAQRQANAERQKRHRDRQKQENPVTSQEDAPAAKEHVTVTSPLHHAPENSREENSREESGGIPPTPPARARPNPPAYSEAFERFWTAYPSGHGVKKQAWDQWRALKPDAETIDAVHAGLVAWKACDRWQRGFVRDAQRWLRDRQFLDPPPVEIAPAPPQRNGYRGKDIGLSTDALMEIARGERP